MWNVERLMLNSTIMNQTDLKKGGGVWEQDLAVLEMAQFKVIPPEIGTENVSLQRWRQAGCSGALVSCHRGLACTSTSSAERIQCRTSVGDLQLTQ